MGVGCSRGFLMFFSNLGVESSVFYVSVRLNGVQMVLTLRRVPAESFGRNLEPASFVSQYLPGTAGIIATGNTEHPGRRAGARGQTAWVKNQEGLR